MKFSVIIPARYASSRFPGKPLAMLGDTTVIERVRRQALKAAGDVAVATDSQEIFDHVTGCGGRCVLTLEPHDSGTERVEEAARLLGTDSDVIINVQGDEPFIDPEQIRSLMALFDDPTVDIATLVRPFDPSRGIQALINPNSPKVVLGDGGFALYFSRSVIPYLRGVADMDQWSSRVQYYTHVGIYAFRRSVLSDIVKLPKSPLEVAESLEQLRWLAAGYRIKTAVTTAPTIGIDTPADLDAAREYLKTITL